MVKITVFLKLMSLTQLTYKNISSLWIDISGSFYIDIYIYKYISISIKLLNLYNYIYKTLFKTFTWKGKGIRIPKALLTYILYEK